MSNLVAKLTPKEFRVGDIVIYQDVFKELVICRLKELEERIKELIVPNPDFILWGADIWRGNGDSVVYNMVSFSNNTDEYLVIRLPEQTRRYDIRVGDNKIGEIPEPSNDTGMCGRCWFLSGLSCFLGWGVVKNGIVYPGINCPRYSI